MATKITDNGAIIKIERGSGIINLTKQQILFVTVIKTNIIKIDIGQGPLGNVFIPYGDVTVPATANPEALRVAIDEMRTSVGGSSGGTVGGATEAKQDIGLGKLDTANTLLNTINTNTSAALGRIEGGVNILDYFRQPAISDESNPNVIYQAFSQLPGASTEELVWAILRITVQDGIKYYHWADGNRNFDKNWLERETLTYR